MGNARSFGAARYNETFRKGLYLLQNIYYAFNEMINVNEGHTSELNS